MEELPALLADAVGDATVLGAVELGGGDRVVVTPTAAYLYRSEGLLADEDVSTYPLDVERFAIGSGRRKRTIHLETIDGDVSFTVPAKQADDVVVTILTGVLHATGVVDPDERIEAQFRFSDLTLVVTDETLLKHVGGAVWAEDYEILDYASLTNLGFEEGSVGTQVIVELDGRQHRVKVPNEHARRVQEAVQSAIFSFHGVSSLGGLRAAVAPDDEEPDDGAEATVVDDVAVTDTSGEDDEAAIHEWSPPADQDVTGPRGRRRGSALGENGGSSDTAPGDGSTSADGDTADAQGDAAPPGAGDDATDAHLAALTEQVERQTELLERQAETIQQLVEELRRGR